MTRPVDLQRIAPIAAVIAVAALGLFLVSRSMGGAQGGGSKDADRVLQQAFSGEGKGPGAGRVRGNLSASVAGPAGAALLGGKPLTVQIRGVVNGETASPKTPASFDLDMQFQGGGENHSFAIVSTGRRGYLTVDGKTYEVPQSQLRQLSANSKGNDADTAALAALGIDPSNWLKNATDAGTEDVAGEPTTHVTADVDTAAFLGDFLKAADRAGQGAQIPAEARTAIQDALQGAKLDVYVAKRDGVVRKLALAAPFEVPNPRGGESVKGEVQFDLEFTGVAKAQRIVAPGNAVPLRRLDPGLGGLGTLSTLKAPGSTGAQNGGGRSATGGRSSSQPSSAKPGRAARTQAYITCVEQAQDVQALNKCQPLVP